MVKQTDYIGYIFVCDDINQPIPVIYIFTTVDSKAHTHPISLTIGLTKHQSHLLTSPRTYTFNTQNDTFLIKHIKAAGEPCLSQ